MFDTTSNKTHNVGDWLMEHRVIGDFYHVIQATGGTGPVSTRVTAQPCERSRNFVGARSFDQGPRG